MVFAELKSLAMFAVGLVAAVVTVAAAYFVLSRRGVVRWLFLGVLVLVPIAVIAIFAVGGVLWVAIVSAGVWLLAGVTARQALTGDPEDWRMPEYPAQPPARRPYLIMNPKSGDGKVVKFDLKRKAEALGAEVFLFGGSGPVDVAAIARRAVANGADLLGVAGGDGTQALVAGIAAEHGLPFVVISAGTRNHFALDLGLDREDPARCLSALADGVELRVDLGVINGQTFVNNASFGAYAEIVETPAYRGDKMGTTLNLLPDLLQGHRGAQLAAQVDGTRIEAPQALLVANNPYGTGDLAGLSRRTRLDGGILGVVGVTVSTAAQAVDLLRGIRATGVSVLTTKQIEITADGAADSGRRRWRVDPDVDAGDLHGLAGRAARLGATRASGRPRAETRGELGQAAATGRRPPRARRGHDVRTVAEHATGLGDAARRAGELSVRTVIFDVEPLVAYWNGTQETLDEGIARVLSEIAKLPTVEVICFSTNSTAARRSFPARRACAWFTSPRRPSRLRTTAYQGFPRPGVVMAIRSPPTGSWRGGWATRSSSSIRRPVVRPARGCWRPRGGWCSRCCSPRPTEPAHRYSLVIISRRGIVRGERGKRCDAAAGCDNEVRDAVDEAGSLR